MAISTFTFGYFWLKRATALVTALSSAALPKAINRKLAETSDPAAKPLLDASTRLAANMKVMIHFFIRVIPRKGETGFRGGWKAPHVSANMEPRQTLY